MCDCYVNTCLYGPLKKELGDCLNLQIADNFGDAYEGLVATIIHDTFKVSNDDYSGASINLSISSCLNQTLSKNILSKYSLKRSPGYNTVDSAMAKAIGLHTIKTAQYLFENDQSQFKSSVGRDRSFFVAQMDRYNSRLIMSDNPKFEESAFLDHLNTYIFSDLMFADVDSLLLFSSVPLGPNSRM